MYEEGRHHLDQDFAAVGRYAGPFLFDGMMRMFDTLGVGPSDVDHYVWSIPTMQLYNDHVPKYIEQLGIRPEQLKFRAAKCGYCGGASLLIHFDEMVRSGELQRGQTAVVYSVESSKWMSAGFFLRW
jgi:3-oxoacyl-[acyl-carrier-protein] synthase III